MKVVISIILALVLLIFLANFLESDNITLSKNETAYSACINSGGIPILSEWASRLTDCLFPPEPLEDKPFELKDLNI